MGKLIDSDTPLSQTIRKIARDVAARVSITNFSCGAMTQVVRA